MAEGVPELRKVVGMRNRIIHGYEAVDELLQLFVAQSIPPEDVAVVFISCSGVSMLL